MALREKWRDIRGYKGRYQVSNLGRIRSLERFVRCQKWLRKVPAKILAIAKNQDGYSIVLLNKNNTFKCFRVSRLVAKYFVPNPLKKKEVNHKFGNKDDNRAISLEWHTVSENRKHAWDMGLNKGNTGRKLKRNKIFS